MRLSAARVFGVAAIVMPVMACNLSGEVPLFTEQTQEAPRSVPEGGYLALGRQLLQRGDYAGAHDAFIRSMRLEGQTVAALSGAGVASEKEGLLSKARRYFELAVAAQPNSVIAHNNLGAVLFKLGDYNQAKQAFQAAFALSSGENDVAARNLAITQQAIRREYNANLEMDVNPGTLQRLGSGEYKLQDERKNNTTEQSEG